MATPPARAFRRRQALGLATTLLLARPALSQAQTPAHSLQAVEHLLATLRVLCQAALVPVPPLVQTPVTPARPRHAFMAVTALHTRLGRLRGLHGLPVEATPVLPEAEVVPAQVRDLAAGMVSQAAALAPLVGNPALPGLPALRDDINPGHVAVACLTGHALLGALGVPSIVPNDTRRIADAVRLAALDLARLRGVQPGAADPVPDDAQPPAAQEEALVTARALHALAERHPGWAPPGGVRLIETSPGAATTPREVLAVTLSLAADLGSVRVRAGRLPALPPMTDHVGTTPAGIVRTLREARMAVAAI